MNTKSESVRGNKMFSVYLSSDFVLWTFRNKSSCCVTTHTLHRSPVCRRQLSQTCSVLVPVMGISTIAPIQKTVMVNDLLCHFYDVNRLYVCLQQVRTCSLFQKGAGLLCYE